MWCRFKAELSRSDLLRQGNMDLVRYLLLRAEDSLSWASISWSKLQVICTSDRHL